MENCYENMNILSIEQAKKVVLSSPIKDRKVVIITGVTGQDGSFMADYLLKHTDHILFGGARRLSVYNHTNIEHLDGNPRFYLINFDLTDAHSISQIINQLKPDYFINMAAQSFVKSSWDFPAQTWETNTTGVLNILESIRLHAPYCRFYNAGCHSTDTRVMTPTGLKYYTDLKIGDLVYSINPQTQALEQKQIKKIFEYDFSGNLMEFKRGGLLVTPNHTMIYKTLSGKILSKKAINFVGLSDVKYPINVPYKGIKLEDKIDLSEFIPTMKKRGNKKYGKHIKEINAYDLMYLIGLYIGDGSSRIMKKKVKIKCLFEERERNSNGQFSPHSENNKNEIEAEYQCPQTILDIPASDKCFPKVISALERNGIRWKLHGSCDITFHQWGLTPYFSECGHSASTKRIPTWIFDLDSSYQMKVLEGIRDSDGDDRHTISTSSKQLQQDLLNIHIRCGIMPTFGERPPRTSTLKDGRIIKGNFPEYHVHGLKINSGYQRGNWKNVPYNGKVWCFEIDDNHNFLVERNGKLTFSGNSSEEFGNVEYSPQDELHPLRPRSPYGASKAAARLLVKVYRESYNLYAIQGWLFNHEGTRRGEEFVSRKITKKVSEIAAAIKNDNNFTPLELGNLDASRDWSDAEDMIDAIWRMLNQEMYTGPWVSYNNSHPVSKWIKEYVVASGETHTVREFVEEAFKCVGIKGMWCEKGEKEYFWYTSGPKPLASPDCKLVVINSGFCRPAEVDILHGNSSLIRNDLKWTPAVSFKELVKKMVLNDTHL